jgi:hypothetical protein
MVLTESQDRQRQLRLKKAVASVLERYEYPSKFELEVQGWPSDFPPYDELVRKLTEEGFLERPKASSEYLDNFVVTELKDSLRQGGANVSGRKNELIERLLVETPQAAQELNDTLGFYVITAKGRKFLDSYRAYTQKEFTAYKKYIRRYSE